MLNILRKAVALAPNESAVLETLNVNSVNLEFFWIETLTK